MRVVQFVSMVCIYVMTRLSDNDGSDRNVAMVLPREKVTKEVYLADGTNVT